MNLQVEISSELWNSISKSYESEIYSNAILEAIHYLSEFLREKADVDGDGIRLVSQALSGENPRLRINKFQTESEKNEQRGLEHILRGLYQGFRNPRSHEKIEDSQTTANSIILLIDLILNIISQSKEVFTLESWQQRVFDADFVASERYAKLIASEVPRQKYVDALIGIYRKKSLGDAAKLKYTFSALLELVNHEQMEEFLSVISEELKITQSDDTIRIILEILPPKLWPKIDEVAQLRIENKLISSIESGKHNLASNETLSGHLGTWSANFVKFFVLKDEICSVLLEKLKGDEEDQGYVAEFFFAVLPDSLNEKSILPLNNYYKTSYIKAMTEAVCASPPSISIQSMLLEICRLPSDWQDLIIEGIKPLQESDSDYYKMIVDVREMCF